MSRKLTFGLKRQTQAFTTPKLLDLWTPKGRKAPVLTYVLPVREFLAAAAKEGYAGRSIGGFAVWGRWWARDAMYFRCDRYAELALHEWRHIETQSNFHGERHA